MALVYNNVRPLDISYNGTQINELKHNGQGVWGRPFSLSITKTVQATVNVNRTSSPNQGAELGNLSDGSTIYYGDVLVITYSFISGYTSDEHSINGKNFDSGDTITVTEALDIVVTAKESYRWHTMWSGSKSITSNTQITTSSNLALKYRATVTTLNETWGYEYTQVVELDVNTPKTVYGTYEMGGGDLADETCGTLKLTLSMSGLNSTIYGTFADRTGSDGYDPYSMTISKLEGYY